MSETLFASVPAWALRRATFVFVRSAISGMGAAFAFASRAAAAAVFLPALLCHTERWSRFVR